MISTFMWKTMTGCPFFILFQKRVENLGGTVCAYFFYGEKNRTGQPIFLAYLVDPASGICLSQRLSHASACMSVYTTKLRMAR